jgi:hypothetical protein
MKRLKRFLGVAGVSAAGMIAFAGAAGAQVSVSVTPNSGLTDGQTVTVSGTLPPNTDFVISQCNDTISGVSFDPIADCDFVSSFTSLDPTGTDGAYSVAFQVWTGTRNGFACDENNPCRIRINSGVFAGITDQAFTPISFAAGGATTTTTEPTTTTTEPTTTTTADPGTTTTTAPTTTTTAPDPVIPEAPFAVLLPLGGAAVLGSAYLLVRRGRVPA